MKQKKFSLQNFDEDFINYISEECLSKNMGIRPLSKIIQENVESKITSLYLSSKLKKYKSITFKKNKDEILIDKEEV
jgi:ATP-dependent Clp protease ATP-binding subunit ClpA